MAIKKLTLIYGVRVFNQQVLQMEKRWFFIMAQSSLLVYKPMN